MTSAFVDANKVKYFLAPKSEIEWTQAAIFAVMSYKKYIYDRVRFETAYNFAKKNTKSGKDFPEYWIS
jgi:hypothetical protein